MNSISRESAWLIHGILLSCSFFVFLPLGSILVRSGSPYSFQLHLIFQSVGALAGLVGITMGFSLSNSITLWHQFMGITLGGLMICQIALGVQHHRLFVRAKERLRVSHAHIWLGRGILVGGWVNLILGLTITGPNLIIGVGSVISAIELGLLILGVCYNRGNVPLGLPLTLRWNEILKRKKKVKWAWMGSKQDTESQEQYFALADEDDDSSDAETVTNEESISHK